MNIINKIQFGRIHKNASKLVLHLFYFHVFFVLFSPMSIYKRQVFSAHSKANTKYKNIYKIDTFAMNDTIATVALYFILKKHDTHSRFQFVFRYSLNIYSISAGHIHAISMNTNFQANEIFLLSPLNFEPMLMIVMKFSGTTIKCYPCFDRCFDYFVNMKVS